MDDVRQVDPAVIGDGTDHEAVPKVETNVEENDIVSDQPSQSESILWYVFFTSFVVLLLFTLAIIVIKVLSKWKTRKHFKEWGFNLLARSPVVVGFFHPYCNAGGGGERVLWQSICALQSRYKFIRCVVYTGDSSCSKPRDILAKVKQRFGIQLEDDVKFVYLKRRAWVEAKRWPRLTLIGQSLGSIILGLEAFIQCLPHVFIDTTGYAFTMPLFRWLGCCKTVSYVHYPVVSRDMLDVVKNRENKFNNAKWITRSCLFSNLKVYYYRLFSKLYGFVGRRSNVVMVNSTWTHGHISQLWKPKRLCIVYPPCDTSSFQQLSLTRINNSFIIVSVGQFRPEKNHELQLQVFKEFITLLNLEEKKGVKLVLVGSCRGIEDEDRVAELKNRAKRLGILKFVQFKVNVSFDELKSELGRAKVALHTMKNEHFGIVLPECMAAGCIMVAHDSGGPKMDIVVDWHGQRVGFLADSKDTLVSCLMEVFSLNDLDRMLIVNAARKSVEAKFSVSVFETTFLRATEDFFC